MIEITENLRLHDFRFEITLELCEHSKNYEVHEIIVYFIGIDDFGVRLTDTGSDYVYHAYYDELNSYINNIVETYKCD